MSVIVGLLSAVLGVGLFLSGFWFGRTVFEKKVPEIAQPEISEEELVKAQDERQKLMEEQKAWRELLAYNTDMAYGAVPNKE